MPVEEFEGFFWGKMLHEPIISYSAKIPKMTAKTIAKSKPNANATATGPKKTEVSPVKRCTWCEGFDAYRHYHDTEWGVPMHDDRALFEKLCLEAMQAGLSWATILKKREQFRVAFEGFDIAKLAKYGEPEVARLLGDTGIVRNRLKIRAVIGNAQAMQKHFAKKHSFRDFLWSFVDGATIHRQLGGMHQAIAQDARSQAMSKTLLGLGFKFVGPTICYSLMQSTGMVNDHFIDCFRFQELGGQV
jgi:DNA-3-methyladenine glycosylase I